MSFKIKLRDRNRIVGRLTSKNYSVEYILNFFQLNRLNMAKKLYVGGLSYNTTDATLKETFSAAGNVESAIIIIDRATNRSKGFGFVEMSTEEEAQKAVEMFNGKEIEGRNVTVNEARPMEPRTSKPGGFNRDKGFSRDNKRNW